MIGQSLGQYRVVDKVGAGGMGVVYKAEDTRLGRTVALKVLLEKAVRDPQAIERFRREARAVSALNHPNICTIHDVGEHEGQPFIVMEFLEGESLRQRVARHPLTPSEIVDVGIQVSDGLDAAHSERLIHRDLKPENLFITRRGHAKILDFGLAKLVPERHADVGRRPMSPESSTTEERLTSPGAALGTVAYMSPEQALGKELDPRTDLFSLGVVFYEMATGAAPFRGTTSAAVFDAILNKQPTSPVRLNPDVPGELERIINKTLEKDRNLRYQTASELRADLQRLKRQLESGIGQREPQTVEVRRRSLLRVGMTVVLACLAIGGVTLLINKVRDWVVSPSPIIGSQTQITFVGDASGPALSPDGSLLAYRASAGKLMLRDRAGGPPVQLQEAGRYGHHKWSPDGSHLLVQLNWPPFNLLLVPRLGGPGRMIGATSGPSQSSWSPDGKQIATVTRTGFALIDVASGTAKEVVVGFPGAHLQDIFDWSHRSDLLLLRTMTKGSSALWTVRPDGSQPQKLVDDRDIWSARWDPTDDAAYYFRRTNDEVGEIAWIRTPRAIGSRNRGPSIVVSGLGSVDSAFSISNDGTRLAYVRSHLKSNLWVADLTANGKKDRLRTKPLIQGTLRHQQPSMSPDGKWLAFVAGAGSRKTRIYKMPVSGGAATQLTFLDAQCANPAWSPDGKRIAFLSDASGRLQVWIVDAEGGQPRHLSKTQVIGGLGYELAWSPGSAILYRGPDGKVVVLDSETEKERPLVRDESFFIAGRPLYSPDGSRVAVKGTTAISVVSVDDGIGRRITTENLNLVGWSADGEALLAQTEDQMVLVPVSGGPSRVLFALPVQKTRYVASPDGLRFFYTTTDWNSDVWLAHISRNN